jgi:hypothetical protein
VHPHTAIIPLGAGFVCHGQVQPELDPVGAGFHRLDCGLIGLMDTTEPYGHACQVPDGDVFPARIQIGNGVIGEERNHLVSQAKLPLVDGDADQRDGQALGHLSHAMGRLTVIWVESGTQDHLVILNDQQAVNWDIFPFTFNNFLGIDQPQAEGSALFWETV